MTKIAHLTSVHPRFDTRIFLKECRSLANAGHEVTLIVADGLGDSTREGVRIIDAGKSRDRLRRMLGATHRVLKHARAVDADVYHLHDPELIPAGLSLKRAGKRVIFDAHEDVPQQILSKPYLAPFVRRIVARIVGQFERFSCRRFDHVVAATPAIQRKFEAMGISTANINNFPMLGELESDDLLAEKKQEICYIGGISRIRGIQEVTSAMALCSSGARLNLGGQFSDRALKDWLQESAGWARINELGFVNRLQVRDVLGRSAAGLVTFLPMPNHIDAQPNKMFEYMSAGVPVIASNFPLWREIIEGNACGICVDPLDPSAIAAAIDQLVEDPDLAHRMGENGRRAVRERYNWGIEERKLLDLYDEL